MAYIFEKSDGGRSLDTKRRKHNNDCMVRALATATGIGYGQVYDELVEDGVFTPGNGGFMDRFVGHLVWQQTTYHGFDFVWRSFAAKKGQPRMNPELFADQFPKGNFILRMGRHHCSMIDGVLRDIFVHTDMRCVYGAWEVRKVHEAKQAA